MIIDKVGRVLPPGAVIPKPGAKLKFIVKGSGTRGGERALVYFVPLHKPGAKPIQKGVSESDWEAAYQELHSTGRVTRRWFNDNLARCAREGPCNFTTIGGAFELLGWAKYAGHGVYTLVRTS